MTKPLRKCKCGNEFFATDDVAKLAKPLLEILVTRGFQYTFTLIMQIFVEAKEAHPQLFEKREHP